MGTDPDLFVHPERISKELICPICTQVLENPVQTPTDHLFCEDELIEWMSRHERPLCPVTHAELKPDSIRKPSRIILNMLAELQRYCSNRAEGCDWVGENEHLALHLTKCAKRPRDEMTRELAAKDEKIKQLRVRCARAEKQLADVTAMHTELQDELKACQRKLKVYDAFFDSGGTELKSGGGGGSGSSAGSRGESALQKLLKLRDLGSFEDEGKA
jgi:E3 ubiquitin-protein ligase NRDP1